MNLSTVAQNLRKTIAGKEQYLESVQEEYKTSVGVDRAVLHSTQAFLAINIDELKRILQDVETCRKQASDDSWITNPDRMGGGGWTADELDPNRGWK